MDADTKSLAADLLKLPSASRAYLVDALIESLGDFTNSAHEEHWSAEVARRMAETESGNVIGIPSEQVHAEARRQLDEARRLSSAGSP